ncbi:unnamed protein product [Victoria cruziana]
MASFSISSSPVALIDRRNHYRGAMASFSWKLQRRRALPNKSASIPSSGGPLDGDPPLVPRLNPNYRSSSVEHDLISSLGRDGKVSSFRRMEEMKNRVRQMFRSAPNMTEMLCLVDAIQQLGLAYHFEDEIGNILSCVHGYVSNEDTIGDHDLHDVSLAFRLLRQHGRYVSPGIFDGFMDGKGSFKHELEQDVRGLLSLYEASFLGMDGEASLYEARSFATAQLQPFLQDSAQRRHHRADRNHDILIELATLDCDYTQSLYKKELWEVSKWWKGLGLAEELGFIRDQVLVWFMFPLSMLPEPQFSDCRFEVAKLVALIYTIDDIYDVHGTMEELHLFTEAVARWDMGSVHSLPKYLEACFMALHDVTMEIQRLVLGKHGHEVLDKLKETWATLTEAYLEEAKWRSTTYVPKTEEYLRNRVVSTGLPTVLVHIYYLMGFEPKAGLVDAMLHRTDGLVWYSAMILRLWDDLGSTTEEQERGYDASYLECYVKEFGTIEGAREHLEHMIGDAWEKMNRECLVLPTNANPLPSSFSRVALNTARICPIMYRCDEDGRLLDLEGHIRMLVVDSVA